MKVVDLFKLELFKMKRSKIIVLLLVAPVLVVVSGVANPQPVSTPEYVQAWPAMFIQSALLYAYYLLPFSMIVVCVMIAGRETQNNGMLKMLAPPISRCELSLAKFGVLVFCLLMEMAVFLLVFLLAGGIAVMTAGIRETAPFMYLYKPAEKSSRRSLPCMAVMWMITVVFEKPLITVGLNLLLVIPGLLAGATPLWFLYPYCYSGYLVSCSLHEFTVGGLKSAFELYPFLPCALVCFTVALGIAATQFGKKEMR